MLTATNELTLPPLDRRSLSIDDVPLIQEAGLRQEGTTIRVEKDGRNSIPAIVRRSEKLARVYEGLSSSLTKPAAGRIKIDQEIGGKLIRLVKSQPPPDQLEAPCWLSIDLDSESVIHSGDSLDLHPDPVAITSDVNCLLEYFENFKRGFHGDVLQLQKDYFLFMSWFFASPYLCDLRNRAIVKQGYIFDFPLFAILFGKSNCGKTSLIQTLMLAMFGQYRFIEKQQFTVTNVRALLSNYRRFPVVFDDVDRKRFMDHAPELIKNEQFFLDEYPAFVLSMNADNHAFATELRKRCLMVYTKASLPDNSQASRKLHKSIQEIRRRMGTSLYRHYLARSIHALRSDLPADMLAFSSQLLVDIFSEYSNERLPQWCAPITVDGYHERKFDKVKTELRMLYETSRSKWTVRRHDAVLSIEPYEAPALRREIPDWVLKEGSKGGTIVMDRVALEEFAGLRLRKSWLKGLFDSRQDLDSQLPSTNASDLLWLLGSSDGAGTRPKLHSHRHFISKSREPKTLRTLKLEASCVGEEDGRFHSRPPRSQWVALLG